MAKTCCSAVLGQPLYRIVFPGKKCTVKIELDPDLEIRRRRLETKQGFYPPNNSTLRTEDVPKK
jgi:hypothetical protein